ncbi:MAG: zinc ribbon domain-containing protein [Desulfobacterales bacterium]|nr:zinc ribbon domain-containing protein [Desulfobacterales bacterium]
MKCPRCEAELPSLECPECHEKVPLEGRFCSHCGAEIPRLDKAVESGEDGIDFSKRTLCSDGTCIGVINEHGVCSECGKPYAGEA